MSITPEMRESIAVARANNSANQSDAFLGRVLSIVPSYYSEGKTPREIAPLVAFWHGSSVRHALQELRQRGLVIVEGPRGAYKYRRASKDLL